MSIYDKYAKIKQALDDGYSFQGKPNVSGPLPGQPGWKPKGGTSQPQPKPVNKNTVQQTQLKKAGSLYEGILNY